MTLRPFHSCGPLCVSRRAASCRGGGILACTDRGLTPHALCFRDGKISYDEFMRALTPAAGKDNRAQHHRRMEPKLIRGRAAVRRGKEVLVKAAEAGVRSNVVTYNALLDACVLIAQAAAESEARWAAQAEDCRADAMEVLAMMRADGVVPNARSYTALVNLCCVAAASGEGESALADGASVLRDMAESGVKADTVVYNSLINAAAKAAWGGSGGGVAPALGFLDMMRQADVKPDTVTYTSLINAARHEGTQEAGSVARAVFDKMPPASRNQRTYTVMMQCLIRVGKDAEALALLDQALSYGIRPNLYMYRAALQAAGQNRKRRYAVESRMREEGMML